MNLCDGDCPAAAKIQELQQLVAGLPHWWMAGPMVEEELGRYRRVLELLDIPTF